MVVRIYNPSYTGGTGRRIKVQVWTRQKYKTLFEKQQANETKARRNGKWFRW
jgi:hypothetical protein